MPASDLYDSNKVVMKMISDGFLIKRDDRSRKDLYIQLIVDQYRQRDILRNFIYLPDISRREEKILCRYPQYYAAIKLYASIKAHRRPDGDGKGGTCFGATGCGKSFTMLFLVRLLMKSVDFASPTIVLITDRTNVICISDEAHRSQVNLDQRIRVTE